MSQAHQSCYLLQHVSSVLCRQLDEILLERLGMGMSQFKILMVLQWTPEVKQSRLASSLGQTEASISRQIKLLAEQGLLTSVVDPNERRVHRTKITPKGIEATTKAREIMAEYSGPIFGVLSGDQQAQLAAALSQIHKVVCLAGSSHACGHPLGLPKI